MALSDSVPSSFVARRERQIFNVMAKEDCEDEGPNEAGGEGDEEHGGVTERLRQRTKRKPVYVEDDESMEDEEWEAPEEEEEEEEDDEDDEKDVRKGSRYDLH
ncbi:hypothetical protein KC19_10G096200 [Ceratodon purpureus]|uniref:Uncharacterized protein n=1 Tax=Ceratodon purpureus TaxID=3225 RepID=A0A8T0GNJ4_CERPU|nr:hypothetical protein KC19_10G096200 [Ceratodon purpureus]